MIGVATPSLRIVSFQSNWPEQLCIIESTLDFSWSFKLSLSITIRSYQITHIFIIDFKLGLQCFDLDHVFSYFPSNFFIFFQIYKSYPWSRGMGGFTI